MKPAARFSALLLSALCGLHAAWAQPAQPNVDQLTDLVVQAMPIGEVFQGFIDKDPRWPLGDKISRVSPEQAQCLRDALSAAGYREMRRQDTTAFVQRYPDQVEQSLRVLKDGGADVFGASIRMGVEQSRTGQKGDFNSLASRFTPLQMSAFVELIGDDKHKQLRELIGVDDSFGQQRSGEEQQNRGRNKGMVMGAKLMFRAMDRCKVPLAAVQ
jgi:hypothetical protein